MLIWLEHHLVVLGLLAVIGGVGLGAIFSRSTGLDAPERGSRRNAGSAADWRRRSPASSSTGGSVTTGAESTRPR